MTAEMEGGATARRALRLLETIAAGGPPRSLDELAAATGLSKSTAYRLLRVLQDEAYVQRNTGGYGLGASLVALAAAALPNFDLYSALRPILNELADTTGETATLHRRVGDVAILLVGAESAGSSLRRIASIGETARLTSDCSGLAILARAPDRDSVVARLVPREQRVAVGRALDAIESAHFSLSDGINQEGVSGIAVSVAATNAGVSGMSIAVSGPIERWTKHRRVAMAGELIRAAAQASTLLDLGQPPS